MCIRDSYEDEAGTMWVGTYKKGISFYNESILKFGIADVGDINCVEDGGGDIVWPVSYTHLDVYKRQI